MAAAPAIELSDVAFRWPGSAGPCLAIPGLTVTRGESLFLRGSSGSGKSTLLGLLSGVLLPTQGEVRALGTELHRMTARARDRFRGEHIGYIFQQFNLVPYLPVVENVLLACRFSARRRARLLERGANARDEAVRLLARLDIGPELLARESVRLSVGQQQRVAAARALIGSPEIVLADEPTSALDADRQSAFLELLRTECEAAGATLVFASHDTRLAGRFDRVFEIPEAPA